MVNWIVIVELEMKGKDVMGLVFKFIMVCMGQMEKQFLWFNQIVSQFNVKIGNIECFIGVFVRVSCGIEILIGVLMMGLKGFGVYVVVNGVKQVVVFFVDMECYMMCIGIMVDVLKIEIVDVIKEIECMLCFFGYSNFELVMIVFDMLVLFGMDLKIVMVFLLFVMVIVQVLGVQIEDIVNVGFKIVFVFKLQVGEMQKVFDDMVYLGKQGQFELKDMVCYILLFVLFFLVLGYMGEDGLKQLFVIFQIVWLQIGMVEEVVVNVQNIFGKVFSQEMIGKFLKFGIDFDKELKNVKKNGEDLMYVFVCFVKEVMKGDLLKLLQFFGDQ